MLALSAPGALHAAPPPRERARRPLRCRSAPVAAAASPAPLAPMLRSGGRAARGAPPRPDAPSWRRRAFKKSEVAQQAERDAEAAVTLAEELAARALGLAEAAEAAAAEAEAAATAAEEARTAAARAALEGSLAAEAPDDNKPQRAAAMLRLSELAMRAANESEAALCRAQEAQLASDDAAGETEAAAVRAEAAVAYAIQLETAEQQRAMGG